MRPRFVLVPAVQVERRPHRSGFHHQSKAHLGRFDIYDNQDKVRLQHGFQDRTAADCVCQNELGGRKS
ncbi:hypothetical protein DBR24_11155 [Pseudomonas sp. HMWF006]|nr:hypothetical protein DBR24_11155 [Pseudomonas sp. HMWF006]PTT74033.1 hypothetical protein DBR26_01530 [Pseudomonas sp. HMWF007]PTT91060.1 hypothetical protein DBR29_12190 [Pseudomonas sp. HMWF005]